ncbi:hypothetical protein D3C87_1611500 [compost metagenome]
MLCEIHQALKINSDIDASIIGTAITTGNFWAIEDRMPFFPAPIIDNKKVEFVCDILDMYQMLQLSFASLQDKIKDTHPADFISNIQKNTVFPGFDGNNEGEYLSILRMMTKLEMYENTYTLPCNSHRRMLAFYQRMLFVYNAEFEKLMNDELLSLESITKIISPPEHSFLDMTKHRR